MSEKEKREDRYFVCALCGMREKYHLECEHIKHLELRFLEKVYFIKDGTGEDLGGFAVGSDCSECHRPVCHSSECSIFYSRRFCKDCFERHSPEFPAQIRQCFDTLSAK